MTHPVPVLVALVLSVVWAAAVVVVDTRTLRIPAELAVAGAVPALAVSAVTGMWARAALGAVALTALYLGLRLLSPSSLGGGDLRLAPAVGALSGVAGPVAWTVALMGSFAFTALAGLVVVAVRSSRRRAGSSVSDRTRTRVPHGPGMVLCAVAVAVVSATA